MRPRALSLGTAAVALAVGMTSTTRTLAGQDLRRGLHVCVGPDQVVRFERADNCPQGQAGHYLSLAEEGVQVPPTEEEKSLLARIEELKRQIGFLTSRVQNLERSAGDATMRLTSKVMAPFEVVDKQGLPLFTVSEAGYRQTPRRGRVHVGRANDGDRFAVFVLNSGNTASTILGEARPGGGLLIVADANGKERAVVSGHRGVDVLNDAGQEVISLGLNPQGRTRGTLLLTGLMQLFDPSGRTVVEAGTENGVGVVRVGPKYRCGPSSAPLVAGVPDCIRGRP